MKLRVLQVFQDKETREHYKPGDVIDVKDAARTKRLVDLALVEKVQVSKKR